MLKKIDPILVSAAMLFSIPAACVGAVVMTDRELSLFAREATSSEINGIAYRLKDAHTVASYKNGQRFSYDFSLKEVFVETAPVYAQLGPSNPFYLPNVYTVQKMLGDSDQNRNEPKKHPPRLKGLPFSSLPQDDILGAQQAGCSIAKRTETMTPSEAPREGLLANIKAMSRQYSLAYCG